MQTKMVQNLTKILGEKLLVCGVNCWRLSVRDKTHTCYVQTSDGAVVQPHEICVHGYHQGQIDVGKPRLEQSSPKGTESDLVTQSRLDSGELTTTFGGGLVETHVKGRFPNPHKKY